MQFVLDALPSSMLRCTYLSSASLWQVPLYPLSELLSSPLFSFLLYVTPFYLTIFGPRYCTAAGSWRFLKVLIFRRHCRHCGRLQFFCPDTRNWIGRYQLILSSKLAAILPKQHSLQLPNDDSVASTHLMTQTTLIFSSRYFADILTSCCQNMTLSSVAFAHSLIQNSHIPCLPKFKLWFKLPIKRMY